MDIRGLYRIIETTENCTSEDLDWAIFDAFDRYDPHLYSSYIPRKDTKNYRTIHNAPEITDPMNIEDSYCFSRATNSAAETRIRDIGLKEKDVFHYFLDFGDEWLHGIRVQSIKETKLGNKKIEIVKWVGDSPPQHPEDDFYGEEYE